jgi:hypothetical protein
MSTCLRFGVALVLGLSAAEAFGQSAPSSPGPAEKRDAARAVGVTGPLVVSDAWPRCTNLKEWANDVLRIEGKLDASDRDKALALYYWTRLFVMTSKGGNEPYEGPYGREQYTFDMHKLMFVWGYADCGFQSAAQEAVWCTYKNDNRAARSIRYKAAGHVMCEVNWGGSWHAYDPLNGIFFVDSDSPTANVLSFAQIATEDALLRKNATFANRSRPFFERVRSWDQPSERKDLLDIRGFAIDHNAWVAGGSDPHVVYGSHTEPLSRSYKDMNWRLPRGTTIERLWDSGSNFYVPQVMATSYSTQGKHYRQAVEWGPSTTNWNAQEDAYNFPKCEPYLKLANDPKEDYFYRMHTLFFSTGTSTYRPDLTSEAYLDGVHGTPTLVRGATAPYLRPGAAGTPQSVVFKVVNPYILADGRIIADVACGAGDAATLSISTDGGANWNQVASGAGSKDVNIGKSRFNATQMSVTGKYEFLLKFECRAGTNPSTVGLEALRIDTVFDSSLMSLPRLVAGANTLRFKVSDSKAVAAPITVTYRWKTGTADATHTREIRPSDFAGNEATYQVQAPGLTRCVSYTVEYGTKGEGGSSPRR